MKKLIIATILSQVLNICAFAQTNDNHGKYEFFIGYSFGNSHKVIREERSGIVGYFNYFGGRGSNNNGFNASAVYNASRYFGVKADVSGTYSPYIGPQGFDRTEPPENLLYNFLGGVQIKDSTSERRFKPFAHALAGVGHSRRKLVCRIGVTEITRTEYKDYNDTGAAVVVGGGLDVRIYKMIAVRAFQLDYNPLFFKSNNENRLRFSTGIVIIR